MKWISSLLLAFGAVLALPLSAHAVTQTILGKPTTGLADPTIPVAAGPVSVFVGDNGSLQAKRGAQFEAVSGMFFGTNTGPATNFWHLRVKGGPTPNVTFGPRDATVTTVSNGPVTGDWTAASPARVDTVMRAGDFEVKQTVLYVAPELRYRVIWDIRDLSGLAIPFVFGTSADLFIEADAGEGVLIPGPNRFLGGRNKFTTTVGGVGEVTSSQLPGEVAATVVPPWASYEEGDPFPVTRRLSSQDAFLNTINPAFMDNAVGVSWNDRATTGLAAGQTARYEVVWHLSRAPAAVNSAPVAPAQEAPRSETAPFEAVPSPPPDSTAGGDTGGGGGAAAAAAPAPAPVAGAAASTAAADRTAPVLRALRVSPRATSRAPKVLLRLSEQADVVLRIVRRAKGRQVAVRTLKLSGLGTAARAVRVGRLAPGSYVVFAHAVDAAGNRGAQRSASLRITRR